MTMSSQREELQHRFNDAMRRAEHYGQQSNDSNDPVHRTINGRDYQQKIQDAQKECRQIIGKLQELNRKEGVKPSYATGNDKIYDQE